MDIGKDLKQSIDLLKHHRQIIFPSACSIVVTLALILIFMQISGALPLVREVKAERIAFDKQKSSYLMDTSNIGESNYSFEVLNYLSRGQQDSPYEEEFSRYLEAKGFWDRALELVSIENGILLAVFIAIGLLFSFYFSAMSFAIISLAMKDQPLEEHRVLATTHRFLLSLLSARIIVGLFIGGPIITAAAVVAVMFMVQQIFGILMIFPLILGVIFYIIYMQIRLIFVVPGMYIEEKGSIESIGLSWKLSKRHMVQVLLVFLIVAGITALTNSVNQPLYESYWTALLHPNMVIAVVCGLLVLVLIVVEAIAFSFEHVYLFYSYMDLKTIDSMTAPGEKKK